MSYYDSENHLTDIRGLCIYFDDGRKTARTIPFLHDEEDVRFEVEQLRMTAEARDVSISKVAAEAIALAFQQEQPRRAARFARALNELVGDHSFLIRRPGGGSAANATYSRLPISTVEEAQNLFCTLLGTGEGK